VAALAAAQHGVVARRQLLELGLSSSAIGRWMAAGRLHPLHAGVYAVGHPRLPRLGAQMAAVLACGAGAVLSHRSAAALWGLRPDDRAVIDVTVPRRTGRRRKGIVVHRVRRLAADDVAGVDGVPATTVSRTLLDLADTLAVPALTRACEKALDRRLYDHAAIERTLARSANGRRGAGRLARVIERLHDEPPLTRSEAERLLLALVAAHGLPRPSTNVVVAGQEADAIWRDAGLIAEVDGYATHGTRSAFERDRRRDQRWRDAGWTVERFTYRQLTGEPERVADVLARRLA
jgi:predicted transcriptional regulator of viral defense system